MRVTGSRAEFFEWISLSREKSLAANLREVTERIVPSLYLPRNEGISSVEEWFWKLLAYSYGEDVGWLLNSRSIPDQRLACLRRMATALLGLDATDHRWQSPNDLEVALFRNTKKEAYRHDRDCLFLAQLCWNSFDEVGRRVCSNAEVALASWTVANEANGFKLGVAFDQSFRLEYNPGAVLAPDHSYSVEATIEAPEATQIRSIVSQGNEFDGGFKLFLDAANLPTFVAWWGPVYTAQGATPLVAGEVYDLKMVADAVAQEIRLSVDGEIVSTIFWDNDVSPTPEGVPLLVGQYQQDTSEGWVTPIYGVRISGVAR